MNLSISIENSVTTLRGGNPSLGGEWTIIYYPTGKWKVDQLSRNVVVNGSTITFWHPITHKMWVGSKTEWYAEITARITALAVAAAKVGTGGEITLPWAKEVDDKPKAHKVIVETDHSVSTADVEAAEKAAMI